MTGEGIAQALETGTLAARAVAYGGHPSNVAGAVPRRGARTRSAPTCGSPARCNACCDLPLGARAALGAAGLTPWTRRNFARWMFEDYPRAIVLTPAALACGNVHARRCLRRRLTAAPHAPVLAGRCHRVRAHTRTLDPWR